MAKDAERSVVTTYWSIGTNLGNREQNLALALRCLVENANIELCGQSAIYETEPVGYTDQDAFLNAVLVLRTSLRPLELLALAQEIEARLGRERKVVWGPRPIDLDLLLYGDLQVRTDGLTVPHPRLHERKFVLVPLAELAEDQIVPGLEKAVKRLLEQCSDRAAVTRYRPVQIRWDWTKMES
ncbi:MAG: 2-amino-4-hydroxy-6-hydroxymethyldihydropteridine diphosphokinase [Deferribacteres bacterium]|nr:2-amino-4-hydroxy-6-hydroxymethyldihydropteridine diphosphokinase [candidate division KSB1 bacterium]MCB9510184.1 2-amino-4-hydroxy-6-hydroxymethyldihydropteridine diphosphokinase [Deferribacteres bacterium]